MSCLFSSCMSCSVNFSWVLVGIIWASVSGALQPGIGQRYYISSAKAPQCNGTLNLQGQRNQQYSNLRVGCQQFTSVVSLFPLCVQSQPLIEAYHWMNKLTIKQLLNSDKHLQTGFIAYCMGVSKYGWSKPLTRKTVKSNFLGLLPECVKDQGDYEVVHYYVVHTLQNA